MGPSRSVCTFGTQVALMNFIRVARLSRHSVLGQYDNLRQFLIANNYAHQGEAGWKCSKLPIFSHIGRKFNMKLESIMRIYN